MTPFDIINIINEKKGFNKPELVEDYSPFVINRGLSMHRDTILFANEMNLRSSLDKDQQFAFYYNAIPKGKRFGKWAKAAEKEENLSNIIAFFQINRRRAEEYMKLFSDDQLCELRDCMIKGGKNGR